MLLKYIISNFVARPILKFSVFINFRGLREFNSSFKIALYISACAVLTPPCLHEVFLEVSFM